MRFPDFLRATTMGAAACATLLAVVTLVGAHGNGNTQVAYVAIGWWVMAVVIGSWMGRRHSPSEQIATLLADARTQMTLPEMHPNRTLMNRLWPLIVLTVVAGAAALVVPQVPAVAAGFAMIWSLLWRNQSAAVIAIEERDGARFYVERTSVWKPMRLIRTPGFRSNLMEFSGQTPPASQAPRSVSLLKQLLRR